MVLIYAKCGIVDIIHKENIEWINVFAVDNVLQRIADPCFIGATIDQKCTVGAKVVSESRPRRKKSVLCALRMDDHLSSNTMSRQKNFATQKMKNGDPAYNFGVISQLSFPRT